MRSSEMKNPLVSVVIPVWNQAHLVANAILSIKTQTYNKWECLVVDDGSDDRALLEEVVRRFNDPRIRLIHTNHGGVVHAQTAGHNEAKGELQTVQAADDLSFPDRLEKGVEHFKKN